MNNEPKITMGIDGFDNSLMDEANMVMDETEKWREKELKRIMNIVPIRRMGGSAIKQENVKKVYDLILNSYYPDTLPSGYENFVMAILLTQLHRAGYSWRINLSAPGLNGLARYRYMTLFTKCMAGTPPKEFPRNYYIWKNKFVINSQLFQMVRSIAERRICGEELKVHCRNGHYTVERNNNGVVTTVHSFMFSKKELHILPMISEELDSMLDSLSGNPLEYGPNHAIHGYLNDINEVKSDKEKHMDYEEQFREYGERLHKTDIMMSTDHNLTAVQASRMFSALLVDILDLGPGSSHPRWELLILQILSSALKTNERITAYNDPNESIFDRNLDLVITNCFRPRIPESVVGTACRQETPSQIYGLFSKVVTSYGELELSTDGSDIKLEVRDDDGNVIDGYEIEASSMYGWMTYNRELLVEVFDKLGGNFGEKVGVGNHEPVNYFTNDESSDTLTIGAWTAFQPILVPVTEGTKTSLQLSALVFFDENKPYLSNSMFIVNEMVNAKGEKMSILSLVGKETDFPLVNQIPVSEIPLLSKTMNNLVGDGSLFGFEPFTTIDITGDIANELETKIQPLGKCFSKDKLWGLTRLMDSSTSK